MTDYVFGANILENLTTGMYQDSKVIYREYIQNACDQIDKAVKDGILKPGEGTIEIWLDDDKRYIMIQDNATGISASTFQQTLGNIADSNKKIGEDKGFRGIGRLCGLAYCKELVFKSSSRGEDTISIMVCDAEKMRGLIDENTQGKKHTANEVLHAINRFEQQKTSDIDSHFFQVELYGIIPENNDLLNLQLVKEYLNFVAPVSYQSSFYYRSEIYSHVKELGSKIDEYNITLKGEAILKKYTTILKDPSNTKYDEIFDVHFKDFYSKDGDLLAWMWVGISKFQKAIPKNNQMRGLRLRKENIQIGGEDALQKLFREDRGNSYFIGEVFAVNKGLIPNSQRDYFNENPIRAEFEIQLRKYFNDELNKIYYNCSAINSAFKKIDSYERKKSDFYEKDQEGVFVDKAHRDGELKVVLESKKEAEAAIYKVEKLKDKADGLFRKVIHRIEDDRPKAEVIPLKENLEEENGENTQSTTKMPHRADRLSKFSKAERKLISKIFSIITTTTTGETAELIIRRIEEKL